MTVSRWGWNSCQARDPTAPLGNLFQCLTTFTVKTKSFAFFVFEGKFVCFILHPVPLTLSLTPLTRVWLCLCCPPSGIYSGESHPRKSQLSCVICSKSLIILVTHCWSPCSVSMSPLHWGAQTRTQHPKLCPFDAQRRGRITSLGLLSVLFFTRGCWLPHTLMAPCQVFMQQNSKSFFCGMAFQQVEPQHAMLHEVFFPECRILCFPSILLRFLPS